jgi:hypothetical protein
MRPNQLPAAPCHRALRFLCQGHSLHSHRLALQRTGLILRSVSLLSHISLAINASSRLFLPYLNIGLNLLRPHQPPTTHPKYLGQLVSFLPYQADSNTIQNINTPYGQFRCSLNIMRIPAGILSTLSKSLILFLGSKNLI